MESLWSAKNRLGTLLAGDLDGDGADELVLDVYDKGMLLAPGGAAATKVPLLLAGLRPLVVADFDGDSKAEILAVRADATEGRVLLGVGDATLPSLPALDLEPRAVPEGIRDPSIAAAWGRAEQLVAIGLPRRSAAELSALGRLSGDVGPDMFLRSAEIYAELGEDALAAEYYHEAASRPELAVRALAGAAAVQRKLGELAQAQELTRQRLALADAGERAAIEAELADYAAALAERPEVVMSFAEPLDPRLTIADPVAVRRGLGERALSVWAAGEEPVVTYPLLWEGGSVMLEVELEVDVIEWGTSVVVDIADAEGKSWLELGVTGRGNSATPEVRGYGAHNGTHSLGELIGERAAFTARIAVHPSLALQISEFDGETDRRNVTSLGERSSPAGPYSLRVTASSLNSSFVGHVWIKSIRASGFRVGPSTGPGEDDLAWRLAEGATDPGVEALQSAPADSPRQVWKIDRLLSSGRIDEAAEEMRALLAAAPEGPVYGSLVARIRRGDDAAWHAAQAAFGPRFVDLFIAGGSVMLRPRDVNAALRGLVLDSPEDSPAPADADPEERERLALIAYVRARALIHAGRYEQARSALAASYAILTQGGAANAKDGGLRRRVLEGQLRVATLMEDRAAMEATLRTLIAQSPTPYLAIELMLAKASLTDRIDPEFWDTLRRELEAARP